MISSGVEGGGFVNLLAAFRTTGQIYHKIGPLLPQFGEKSKFAQIYFVGYANNQIKSRHSIFDDLNRNKIETFQKFFYHPIND